MSGDQAPQQERGSIVSVCDVPALGLCGQVLSAVEEPAEVLGQELIAPGIYRMRLRCPQVARQILPGQFFMLRSLDRTDPLLGRPFALLDIVRDAAGEPIGLDFGYHVVGKFTNLLSQCAAGTVLDIWGPLGNGFAPVTSGHLAIVAGGIGQTPFVAVLKELLGLERYGEPTRSVSGRPSQITFCYGARTKNLLAGMEWFQLPGVEIRVATDDGTAGHHGFVTDVLQRLMASANPPTTVLCCGPEPMMRAVQKLTVPAQIPAWLSLESPMACGFGACFSCVARIRQPDGSWDYRRTCVEGPIFPAADVVFEADA
ncbi:dihydroorotate dehydrogenase electron transfer subunit [bacterium]|nr:dihydroorotate dehydrogenase electron transfer subunit [bacterium]